MRLICLWSSLYLFTPSQELTDPNFSQPVAQSSLAPSEKSATWLYQALKASFRAQQATLQLLQMLEENGVHPSQDGNMISQATNPDPKSSRLGLPLDISLSLQGIANYAATTAIAGKADIDIAWYPVKDWDISSKLQGAYGETRTRSPQTTVPTAANAAFSLRAERTFQPWIGCYLQTGALTDRIAQIAYNVYGELGGSVTWWQQKHQDNQLPSLLQTDLGLRTFYEYQRSYFPIAKEVRSPYAVVAPTLALTFQHEIRPQTYAKQDMILYFNAIEGRDIRITSTTSLGLGFLDNFTWLATANIRWFSHPIGDSVSPLIDIGTGLQFTL